MEHPFIAAIQKYRSIPAQQQGLILSWFKERQLKEGDVLFPGGHVCRELYFIVDGVLRIGTTDDKGNDVTYFFLKENQLCTILKSFTDGIVAPESISAACDSIILSITRSELLSLYEEAPYLKAIIEEIQHRQMMDKISLKNSFQGRDAFTNYKAFIEQFPDIARRVPLKDVASFLGITPQSLSRLRRQQL